MSQTSSAEPPLERLNYYNGQRLTAPELRLEQAYHLRVRRALNRALYTAGIANGLEVVPDQSDKRRVIIRRGMAIDHRGREILLLDDTTIPVRGVPSESPGVVYGNFLMIQYGEEKTGVQTDGCRLEVRQSSAGHGCGCVSDRNDGGTTPQAAKETAWGGPGRIREEPVFTWQARWPDEASGRIVLAQVELSRDCEVVDVRAGVRRLVSASQPPRVRSYALEGEKDINAANAKTLHFHVRGGRPEGVFLYLRGSLFSSLHYTEVGQHAHTLSLTSGPARDANHTHNVDFANLETQPAGSHRHEIWSDSDDPEEGSVDLGDPSDRWKLLTGPDGVRGGAADMEVKPAPDHTHKISAGTIKSTPGQAPTDHSHSVGGTTALAGQSIAIRAGGPYTYVDGLEVWLNGSNITTDILTQLGGPAAGWAKLGDGSNGHPFVSQGTGLIDLTRIPSADLIEKLHTLEFTVKGGGGQVHYNLYVE